MTNYTPDFELFWQSYPGRWDGSRGKKLKRKKYPAFEAWKKLTKEQRRECLGKRKKIWQEEGSYPRDCVTWLNQWGWEDIVLPENQWIRAIEIKMKEITPTVNFHDERNKQLRNIGK